ncbi:MAG TPA: nucleotide exchange factor GrpE [Methylovirgula sp.]|nr:nucleotide exchange factor GrpE [Methylovirgula sp.]
MPDAKTTENTEPVNTETPARAETEAFAQDLQRENAELKDKLLRTLADMENLRRRTEKEVADAKLYGISAFARDMLSFVDNAGRALANVPRELRENPEPSIKTLIEGIELTERDFQARLARHKIKKMDALGAKFDPNLHEALFEMPDDSVPSGTVVKVVEDGYTIGDRVLRPAKVGVSRARPEA